MAKSLFFLFLGGTLSMLAVVIHEGSGFHIQDRQVMAGEWSISIQTQPCDKGELGVHMPERDGDVITVYCKTMPVAAR